MSKSSTINGEQFRGRIVVYTVKKLVNIYIVVVALIILKYTDTHACSNDIMTKDMKVRSEQDGVHHYYGIVKVRAILCKSISSHTNYSLCFRKCQQTVERSHSMCPMTAPSWSREAAKRCLLLLASLSTASTLPTAGSHTHSSYSLYIYMVATNNALLV